MTKNIFKVILLIFIFSPICKAEPNIQAEKFVENLANKLIEVSSVGNQKNIKDLRYEMTKTLKPHIDFHFITKFIIKDYYHKLKAKNKNRLEIAIKDFFIAAYSSKFNGYKGEKFKINGSKGSGSYYEVGVTIDSAEIKNIKLSFRLRYNKRNNKFKVFDLILEEVSLLQAQKKAFDSRVNTVGVDDFIIELEEKIAEINNRD